MRDLYLQRDVNSRTRGPAVTAAGDGLEGAYSAYVHVVPSGGLCKVIIPALDRTHYKTARCSASLSASIGDVVLVLFDEQKQPWIVVH